VPRAAGRRRADTERAVQAPGHGADGAGRGRYGTAARASQAATAASFWSWAQGGHPRAQLRRWQAEHGGGAVPEVAFGDAGDREVARLERVDEHVAVQLALGGVHGRVRGEDLGERAQPAPAAEADAGAGQLVARRPQPAGEPADGLGGQVLRRAGGPRDQLLGGAGVQVRGDVERLPGHLRVGQVEPPPVDHDRRVGWAGERHRHRPTGVGTQADRRRWHPPGS
jgi:hypothetical protein